MFYCSLSQTVSLCGLSLRGGKTSQARGRGGRCGCLAGHNSGVLLLSAVSGYVRDVVKEGVSSF